MDDTGYGLATLALVLATVEKLRQRGLFNQQEYVEIIDMALLYCEGFAAGGAGESARPGRKILELVLQQVAPRPSSDPGAQTPG